MAVRLQLLRSPQLLPEQGEPVRLNKKDAALLALLALDGPATRERTIALLWPDDGADKARNALRQRLFRLKAAAGGELVRADAWLVLAPEVVHDLQDVAAALAADAAALPGEILEGHDYGELGGFDAWLAQARERWRGTRRDRLAAIASRLEEGGQIAAALAYAERLVRDEPLLEHAVRRLMRLHYRRGDRSAALAAFERFRVALDAELGETPSRETRELVALIEASLALPVATPPPAPVAVLRPPRLIGRSAERAALEAAWSDARLALVRGEPGMGKSRLLGEFCAAHDVRIAALARPGDDRVPWALLARLLRALLHEAPPALLSAAERAELAHVLPEIGAPGPGPLAPGRLRAAVEHWLAAAAPAAVAIDDLQFADAASLELLPALIDAPGAPRRWLVAMRPVELPPAFEAWVAQLDTPRWTRIELGPLAIAEVAELLASLAVDGVDAGRWAPRLHRHTGGNPMFILETLLAVLREGARLPGDEEALPVPGNLGELIERRLGQLAPLTLKLARVMALAGQDFSVDLAAAVLELHPLDLTDAWGELDTVHVARHGALAHDLIQQALRRSLPQPLTRWLHAHIAAFLDAHAGVPARRAHHWQEAGESARAGACWMLAAQAARQAGRRAEEFDQLDAAAACFDRTGAHARRFEALILAVIASREVRSIADAAARAEALLAIAADDRERGIACKELGVCHLQAGSIAKGEPWLARAIDLLHAAGAAFDENHTRYLHAMTHVHLRGAAHALAAMEPLVPWADALEDRAVAHAFGSDFAIVLDLADQRRRAAPVFERSIAYFDSVRDLADSAVARTMLGRSLLPLGQAERAAALLEVAMRDRAELADGDGGQGVEALHLGRTCNELGRYADALRVLRPLHQRLQEAGSPVLLAGAAIALARTFACLGQAARALALLGELPDALPYYVKAGALWVRALLAAERPVERRRLLDEAVACFTPVDLPSARLPIEIDAVALDPAESAGDRLLALIDACEAHEVPAAAMAGRARRIEWCLARGDVSAALAQHELLQHALDALSTCLAYRPELDWIAARAAAAAGDPAQARSSLQRAVDWIFARAAADVPADFRDSFLHRQAVNRAILAAAGRL